MKWIRSQNNFSSIFLILIAAIAVIVAYSLKNSTTEKNENFALASRALPQFSLPSLFNSSTLITNQALHGQVYLINFWASWCSACEKEHETLSMIANTYHVPVLGILFKDNAETAKTWLSQAGNPYSLIAVDSAGSLSRSFTLYGLPETFLIDKNGMIRYRYAGTLSKTDWENILLPLVEKYQNKQN